MIREREIQGCALKDPRTCEGELKSLKAWTVTTTRDREFVSLLETIFKAIMGHNPICKGEKMARERKYTIHKTEGQMMAHWLGWLSISQARVARTWMRRRRRMGPLMPASGPVSLMRPDAGICIGVALLRIPKIYRLIFTDIDLSMTRL
jgi:hypothetical protein